MLQASHEFKAKYQTAILADPMYMQMHGPTQLENGMCSSGTFHSVSSMHAPTSGKA
jgi:hypothetical protein